MTMLQRTTLVLAGCLLLAGTAHAAPFTAGDLAVLQAAASANNTTASVIEIDTGTAGQTAKQTIAISSGYRFSGSATSTGYVSHSDDGSLLTFNGTKSTNTSANANTLNPRVTLTLDASGAFAEKASYTGASGDQTRSSTSLNNTAWFIADQGGLFTNSSASASPSGNFRGIKAFGGAVYVGQQSGTATNITVSTSSAPSGGTVTGLPGLPNDAAFQDFYLIQSGANGTQYDVLYTLSSSSASAGTLKKYSRVSNSWVANGSGPTAVGGFGLAAKRNGSGASLFLTTGAGATAANSVVRFDDAAGHNATINLGSPKTLFTAAAGVNLKGIDLAPATACAPGSFSASGFAPCTPCAAGSSQSLSGQTSCPPCAAGSSQSLSGQTACAACAAGLYQNLSGQTACLSCAAGFYQSMTGQDMCVACSPGSFADASGATMCLQCLAGSAAPDAASIACTACAGDTVSPDPGAALCQACPDGENADEAHTACVASPVACAAGSFSSSGFEPCSACAAGTYQNLSGQTACLSCAAGFYQSLTGQMACLPCAFGSAQSQTGQSACVACTPGTFASTAGAVGCQPCAPGTAIASSGSQVCAPCAGDTISADAGAQACQACPDGQQANGSHTACVQAPACIAGTFSSSGFEPCTSCEAGFYQSLTGQTACLPCAVGSAQSQTGQTMCLPCAAGSYQSLTGQSTCIPCTPGTFADVSGEAACQICPPGSAAASSGSQACAACTGNTTSPNTGAQACQTCPDGQLANGSHTACVAPAIPVPAVPRPFAIVLAALMLLLGRTLIKRRQA
jgi:Tyrosine-protein kinase ephrin type A/B receptor-like